MNRRLQRKKAVTFRTLCKYCCFNKLGDMRCQNTLNKTYHKLPKHCPLWNRLRRSHSIEELEAVRDGKGIRYDH